MPNRISRRSALRTLATSCLLPAIHHTKAATPTFPPIRTVSRGPAFHWFGYYDKQAFDPTNRFVLSNQVNFEHRTPSSSDSIRVGMIDTSDNDRWIELGTSHAWGWQQGCMLQWIPQSTTDVLWNDRESNRHVCRILNTQTRQLRTIPHPIYTLSPDGTCALSLNFSRLQVFRPGYGYVGIADPHSLNPAPEDEGIYLVDLQSGEASLILSLSQVAAIPHQGKALHNVHHWFNHLLISPDGKRFIALHRWREWDAKANRATSGFTTRMITANLDGSDLFILDPSGHTSHFIWRDPEHICMWTQPEGRKAAFYVFRDHTREIEIVGEEAMPVNGHNTYVPHTNNEWILNDTYPQGEARLQKPYLYHIPSNHKVELGHFYLPPQYQGEWRCDTHPRTSPDGQTVAIDSPHTNAGRQLHLIDISQIVRV